MEQKIQKIDIQWNRITISIPIRSGKFYIINPNYTQSFKNIFWKSYNNFKKLFTLPKISIIKGVNLTATRANPFDYPKAYGGKGNKIESCNSIPRLNTEFSNETYLSLDKEGKVIICTKMDKIFNNLDPVCTFSEQEELELLK